MFTFGSRSGSRILKIDKLTPSLSKHSFPLPQMTLSGPGTKSGGSFFLGVLLADGLLFLYARFGFVLTAALGEVGDTGGETMAACHVCGAVIWNSIFVFRDKYEAGSTGFPLFSKNYEKITSFILATNCCWFSGSMVGKTCRKLRIPFIFLDVGDLRY